jgi:hypothetical protein
MSLQHVSAKMGGLLERGRDDRTYFLPLELLSVKGQISTPCGHWTFETFAFTFAPTLQYPVIKICNKQGVS